MVRQTRIVILPGGRLHLEFACKLPHRQASHVSVAHQDAKLFEETSYNIFKSRPLCIEIFRVKPDMEDATVSTNALQSFSEPPQAT